MECHRKRARAGSSELVPYVAGGAKVWYTLKACNVPRKYLLALALAADGALQGEVEHLREGAYYAELLGETKPSRTPLALQDADVEVLDALGDGDASTGRADDAPESQP
eukprot:1493190-Alexandrium_andersonii.AAC.1